jgi:signal transduction histidine kinase
MSGANTTQPSEPDRTSLVATEETKERAPILIVDDDSRNLFAIENVLEDLGELVSVRSGEEALKQMLRHDFAVVLLDVFMPGLTGYETAEMIRRRERSRHTPIIFLTAVNRDAGDISRGYAMGAVDYVLKPVDPLILKSKVAVFVDLFNKTQEIRRKAEHEQRLLEENLRVRIEKLVTEEALRRVEERQAQVIRSLPIALYSHPLDASARGPQFISPTISALCGYSIDAFAREPDLWRQRIHPDDRDTVIRAHSNLAQEGHLAIEYRWRCADGEYRSFFDQATLLRDDDSLPREVVGSWLDVTERRRLEAQLVRAQKMDALGRMTGGIAHDFNNMLTVIIGSLEWMRRKGDASDGMRKRIDMALEGAHRCAEMTQRLLAFARRQPLRPEPLDFNLVVGKSLSMLKRIAGETTEVEIDAAADLWLALADPAQLESALVNLAVNARDAMPEGGRLTVRTHNARLGPGHPVVEAGLPPGDYVCLAVSDTGTGIPVESIERVFEPFFTTKDVGHGTGLGLSITYGFVRQSGGHIEVESELDQGTTFRIYLPRTAETGAAKADQAAPAGELPRARSGEVVLVVEDDFQVRQLAVTMLGDLGYAVLEAENAGAALALLGTNPRIDLLFSDIVMRGQNGIELAVEAKRQRPQLKVLLTSAYYAASSNGSAADTEHGRILPKPYRERELASAIRSALA